MSVQVLPIDYKFDREGPTGRDTRRCLFSFCTPLTLTLPLFLCCLSAF